MKKNNTLLGALFIIIGGLLLSAKYLFGDSLINLGPEDFWPMIILLVGVAFELAYYVSLKAPGFLVPGGILTTYGILFFFEAATNFRFAEYTWPVYLIGVAVGLFQLYMHTGKPRGLLIAISIISGIAVLIFIVMLFRIFLSTVDFGLVIPAILIVVGALLVLGKGRMKSNSY
ncbi:MAG: hypothetical protein A2Y21_08070 [Clostridiales bacterium GWC2_40_7]|nr:MAG: hypothetical protein A2Y21_08070 [Clostridiales bacterium GWC2_40_7]